MEARNKESTLSPKEYSQSRSKEELENDRFIRQSKETMEQNKYFKM